MPIRENSLIEETLSTIQLSSDPPPTGVEGARLPLRPAIDEKGQVTRDDLWLHYSADTQISFHRLLAEISKQLEKEEHARPDEFAIFVLAFARMMSPHEGTNVARLNAVLASVSNADVSLFYFIPPVFPDFYKFEIPPFRFGRLRADTLRHRCERAGSDYYHRYREALPDSWAVEREPKKTRVFDAMRLRSSIFDASPFGRKRDIWEYRAWDELLNGYFSVQNRVLFDDFWAEVVSAQDPFLALGASYFDPRSVQSMFQSSQVAVFLNMGELKTGFVAPGGFGVIEIDLANIHVRVPQIAREMKQDFGFEQFDNSPLDRSIKLFASFVARARRHQLNGLVDEALLHFIIALELLFGVREGIQRSVSERVGVLTFRAIGRSYEDQRGWINKIYDLRSRYVHEGKKIADNERVEELYTLCQQVFRCLLRLQAANCQSSQKEKETLERWLSLLDFLSKGLIAGIAIHPDQFNEACIS